jgi:hypothetical protein
LRARIRAATKIGDDLAVWHKKAHDAHEVTAAPTRGMAACLRVIAAELADGVHDDDLIDAPWCCFFSGDATRYNNVVNALQAKALELFEARYCRGEAYREAVDIERGNPATGRSRFGALGAVVARGFHDGTAGIPQNNAYDGLMDIKAIMNLNRGTSAYRSYAAHESALTARHADWVEAYQTRHEQRLARSVEIKHILKARGLDDPEVAKHPFFAAQRAAASVR